MPITQNTLPFCMPLLSEQQQRIKPVEAAVCPEAVQALAQIRHPMLPALRGIETIALDEQDPKPCFLFDFLPGTSLDQLNEAERVVWTADKRLSYFASLARGVDFLHHQCQPGLMHLDIKPSNLLLGPDLQPRLIDFDTLSWIAESQRDGQGEVNLETPVGLTRAYAAPELLAGRPEPASDIFAIGLCLHWALTGETPQPGCRPRLESAAGQVSPAVAAIIGRCLMSRPDQRYDRAADLAADIEALAKQPSLPECPASTALPSAVQDPARLICIWDGSEFGCELAVSLRQYYNKVLVIDGDLISPQADLLLGRLESRQALLSPSARENLNQAMVEIERGTLTSSRLRDLVWETLAERVDLLVFGAPIDEYDHIPADSLLRLLEVARLSYPVIILLVNRFIYDAFTCLGLMTADQVLVPISGCAADIRSYNRAIDFLALRRQILPERTRFVAFDYDDRTDLSLGTLDALCSGQLVGSVQTNPARQRRRGSAKPYALAMSPLNAKEYDGIIARLNQIIRKEHPDADHHVTHPVRRTIRFLSRQAAAT